MKKVLLKGMGAAVLALSIVLSGCSDLAEIDSVSGAEPSESVASVDRAASSASGLSTGTISSNTTYGDFTLLQHRQKP